MELQELLLKNQDENEVIKVGIVGDLITFIQGFTENLEKIYIRLVKNL